MRYRLLGPRLGRLVDKMETEVVDATAAVVRDAARTSGRAEALLARVTELIGDLDATASELEGPARGTVAATVARLNQALAEVQRQLASLGSAGLTRTLARVDALIESTGNALGAVEKVARSVEPAMAPETIADLKRAIANLDFVLRLLASDSGPLLENLNAATWNVLELTRELKRDPGVVLRGKPNAE